VLQAAQDAHLAQHALGVLAVEQHIRNAFHRHLQQLLLSTPLSRSLRMRPLQGITVVQATTGAGEANRISCKVGHTCGMHGAEDCRQTILTQAQQ
jgi:hypothetical protein